jgi:hypothetical protein
MNASVAIPLVDGTVVPPGPAHPGAAARTLEYNLGARGGFRLWGDAQK